MPTANGGALSIVAVTIRARPSAAQFAKSSDATPAMRISSVLSVSSWWNKPCPARSERHPHGDLALTLRRARQQEVRHVRACHEQHQRRQGGERVERHAELAPESGEAAREGVEDETCILLHKVGHRGVERAARGGHLVLGRADDDVQPPDVWLREERPARVGVVGREVLGVLDGGLRRQRHPDVHGQLEPRAREIRRTDADDRERRAVDGERAADDVACAGEAALPVGVADDGDRAVSEHRIGAVRKGASHDRRRSEHGEVRG